MKDSRGRPTTSFSSKGRRSPYTLEKPPKAAHISYDPKLIGKQYGRVKIIDAEKRWNSAQNHCYVLTECVTCGKIEWQNYSNLRTGRSKGCQTCSRPRQIPRWLDRRLTAAKQRCENPKDPGYHNYGARGIRFEFQSVLEAGLYLISTYGLPDRAMEIDRIDNNGSYAPGNLRFVTHKENCANRRITTLTEFDQKYWPYAENTVRRKLGQGKTRDEIIAEAELAVKEKRKNWPIIKERLESMTYEMPGPGIVTPYRGT